MRHVRRLLVSLAISLTLFCHSLLAQATHPVVPGFERFYSDDKADSTAGGRLLLGELNCVACHKSEVTSIVPKKAPVLDKVGERVRVTYLREFLRDPQKSKPGTTMPNLFVEDVDVEAKVEALVHLLASTAAMQKQHPKGSQIASGRDLYQKVGCFACHGPRDAAGKAESTLPTSVPLGNLTAKYSIPGLTSFLRDPLHVRPSGRMPRLLNNDEARDVAHYLLQGAKVDLSGTKGATKYSYYEGRWDKLPEFDKMKPVATGFASGFDLEAARRGDDFGFRFEGYFQVDREETYTFTTNSDDGSRLYVDGKQVVDNDGIHGAQTKSGKVKLTKGVHKVVVDFFEAQGGVALAVTIEAPGLGKHNFDKFVAPSPEVLAKKPVKIKDEDYIAIRPELVEQGKQLFVSEGCVNCHDLKIGNQRLVPANTYPALAKLGEGGCLSDKPTRKIPWYGLSDRQRQSLTSAVEQPDAPKAVGESAIAQSMTRLNCYACHSRNKVGGPEEKTNPLFLTTQPEMGDEGRVPPPLDGVGAKLKANYLKKLLDQGVNDRPYMHTRMPGFGSTNVEPLLNELPKLDKLPPVDDVKFSEPVGRVKSKARHLVGGKAFGCIKCHTFKGNQAEGVQGIDMIKMPERLRRDWFHAYITDPQKIRPGTRMPTAFSNGKSALPDILDGTALSQIEAMWLYLADGPKAQLPFGTKQNAIPLVPEKDAILYRNFIQGAGSRAIGVGYPERINLAFDANDIRLAMIWQGDFIDAARHWTKRGQGYEGPLGDNVLYLPTGPAFATLDKPDAPWPTTSAKEMGYKFQGYRLTSDDRPTFLYAWESIASIEDFPNIADVDKLSLSRTITLTAQNKAVPLTFRAAVGSKIESVGEGVFQIDGVWKLEVQGAEARVRSSGGKAELLVPVVFRNGKAMLTLEYLW